MYGDDVNLYWIVRWCAKSVQMTDVEMRDHENTRTVGSRKNVEVTTYFVKIEE